VFQQREIGLDVPSFEWRSNRCCARIPTSSSSAKCATRDVRDGDQRGETGHLVFSTMHAATVAQSLTRLFESFAEQQIRPGVRSPAPFAASFARTDSED